MKTRLVFLGYCGKCGRDVFTDFCEHCQMETQPKETIRKRFEMPIKKMKRTKTERGFIRYDFDDLYGSHCSIQKSSLVSVDAIWLGVDEGSPGYKNREGQRMHLNQAQVQALLPLLKRFIKTGQL